jgi:hypothetical protein
VQYRVMASQKKILSPDLSRRNQMKAEEMRKLIHSFRGKFKTKPGDKPFAEWMADLKREEKELEERKFQRFAGEKSVNSKD